MKAILLCRLDPFRQFDGSLSNGFRIHDHALAILSPLGHTSQGSLARIIPIHNLVTVVEFDAADYTLAISFADFLGKFLRVQ